LTKSKLQHPSHCYVSVVSDVTIVPDGWVHHDIAIKGGVPGHDALMYGDDLMGTVNGNGGCIVSDILGVWYGGIAYNWSDGARGATEDPFGAEDPTWELKRISPTQIEWWVHSGPMPAYGGGLHMYFKGVYIGLYWVPEGVPDYVGGHGYITG
jgi:hypothetical protein